MNKTFFTRLTTKARKSLIEAHKQANNFHHTSVGSEHILFGIALQKGSIGGEIMNYVGLNPKNIRSALLSLPQKGKKQTPIESNIKTLTALTFTNNAKAILEKAFLIAFKRKHSYVGTEHLLYGIMNVQKSNAQKLLTTLQTNKKSILQHIDIVLKSTSKFHNLTKLSKKFQLEQQASRAHPEESMMRSYKLEDLSINLSKKSLQKDFDPVIGREKEIDRITSILNRRTKNNPILIGEPGVGKTAIVEGLAKKIQQADVPDSLIDKTIFQLDLTALVAGTMYRGEFEERLKKVIDSIKKNKDIILFIDEIHTIIGAGSVPGSLDAANIIKPALARGEIRCIGATTITEYKHHIEKDAALERRFQQVQIDEPSRAESKKVLAGIKQNYERYHQIEITDQAIDAAVELSARYLQDRFLPDKAVDLIDEAASKFRTNHKNTGIRKKIKELENKLTILETLKQQSIVDECFSRADLIKQRQVYIRQELERIHKLELKDRDKKIGKITDTHISEIVSQITKIPVTALLQEEKKQILHIEKNLQQHIVGQDHAIRAIAGALRRHRAGVSNPHRPIGSFLFLGPSGVGKTELSKVLAQTVFQDKKALIRVDMSEYRESFNISKLIGAPAGYVGFEEGGKLTEQVRRKPYSVILFDEIEKAHPDVWNVLLQILEDGILTDASGRTVNFKNTIIILTSNIGSKELTRQADIGFGASTSREKQKAKKEYNRMKQKVLADLKNQFQPEFLGRIDNTIVFRALDKKDAKKIVELELAKLIKRLSRKGVKLRIDNKAKNLFVQKGFRKEQGARPIRRIIEDYLESQIAEILIRSKKDVKKPLHVSATKTKIRLT